MSVFLTMSNIFIHIINNRNAQFENNVSIFLIDRFYVRRTSHECFTFYNFFLIFFLFILTLTLIARINIFSIRITLNFYVNLNVKFVLLYSILFIRLYEKVSVLSFDSRISIMYDVEFLISVGSVLRCYEYI